MVRLKNIKRNDTFIEADYFPEDKEDFGHIVLDIKTKEVISIVGAKEDKEGSYAFYLPHAYKCLRELIAEDELPETRLVMWY